MTHSNKLININGDDISIDTELVTLIKELNKVGLKTTQCCKGGKNTIRDDPELDYPAYIGFEINEHMTIEFKPIGAYGKQNLVIRWKMKDKK